MELNVWFLVTLGVAVESFGTLVWTVVIDKLTPDIDKLLIAKHIKDAWNFIKILELLNGENWSETVNMEGKNVD